MLIILKNIKDDRWNSKNKEDRVHKLFLLLIYYAFIVMQKWIPKKSTFSILNHLVLNQRPCTTKSSIGGITYSKLSS